MFRVWAPVTPSFSNGVFYTLQAPRNVVASPNTIPTARHYTSIRGYVPAVEGGCDEGASLRAKLAAAFP